MGAGGRRTGTAGSEDREANAARQAPACVLVIFGASGDLTERKLLPAIRQLAVRGRLRPEFALVGVARTAMSDEEWAGKCLSDDPGGTAAEWAPKASFRYISGGYDDPDTYRRLRDVLADCDRTLGTAGRHVFYLATPPRLFGVIAVQLGGCGLNAAAEGGWPRLVIEKPFGWDEASARALYADISAWFTESQIFRIDHYLAKDTVQNLLALRFANSIFEPIWNRTWVDNVQLTVSETLGVGSRGGFYDTTGAVRDIVQNHVLQVLSLFLMEPPTSYGNLRRAEAAYRQLAVGRCAGVRADRQAPAAPHYRGGHGVPATAAASAVPSRSREAGTGRAHRAGAAQRGHQPAVRRQGARP
jgi:glucose-6-phosphate 1-dehydrogenase